MLAAGHRLRLTAAGATDGLLLLNAAQLAFAYMPALATHRAQNATLGNRLAEPLEKLLLAFTGQ